VVSDLGFEQQVKVDGLETILASALGQEAELSTGLGLNSKHQLVWGRRLPVAANPKRGRFREDQPDFGRIDR